VGESENGIQSVRRCSVPGKEQIGVDEKGTLMERSLKNMTAEGNTAQTDSERKKGGGRKERDSGSYAFIESGSGGLVLGGGRH